MLQNMGSLALIYDIEVSNCCPSHLVVHWECKLYHYLANTETIHSPIWNNLSPTESNCK